MTNKKQKDGNKSQKNGGKGQESNNSPMGLVETWRNSRPFVDGLKFRQIVAVAGDGELGDGKESSRQLRAFLGEVPLPYLRRYAEECLVKEGKQKKDKFLNPNKGFALQDVVNQIGQRLGFKVLDGRYKGVTNASGQDGVWELPDGRVIVVEVKTTDAYRFGLDKPADYQRELLESRPNLSEKTASVLLVVGREDTGGLEAQIRGSSYAESMRVISVDALLKIAEVKEGVEEPTFRRIRDVLIPQDFIRLDGVAELVLSVAADSSGDEDSVEEEKEKTAKPVVRRILKPLPPFKQACIKRVRDKLMSGGEIAADLIRRSLTTFSTPDDKCRVVLFTSKSHMVGARRRFFCGLQGHHKAFLAGRKRGWLVVGGDSGGMGTVFLIPQDNLLNLVPKMPASQARGHYLNIQEKSPGKWTLVTKGKLANIDLSPYLLRTDDEA